VAIAPDSAAAQNVLGWALLQAGNYPQAESALRRASPAAEAPAPRPSTATSQTRATAKKSVAPAPAPPPTAPAVATVEPPAPAPEPEPAPVVRPAPAPDRWQLMADAIAQCGREGFFAGVIYEQRVRIQY